MTPITFVLIVFAISLAAGVLGALLGLGGGIIVVPALTLLLGIDIRYAIGASIVSVIATSSGAAAAYVRQHMTTSARPCSSSSPPPAEPSVAPFWPASRRTLALHPVRFAAGLFGPGDAAATTRVARRVPPDPLADRLRLHGSYFDEATGEQHDYRIGRSNSACADVSGRHSERPVGHRLGRLKVPAMDLAMGIPMKVSTATSNFMIGVTAAASAGVYFSRGDIDPFVAGPVAAGVVLGAFAGSRLLSKLSAGRVRMLFVIVLIAIALQMLYRGVFGNA